jgi:glycogen(starch) synthase
MRELAVLLVGSYPPPHGGVSVHVASLRGALAEAGVRTEVLNLDPRAPRSPEYRSVRGGADLMRAVRAQARRGHVVHLHTNGHNVKSWLITLAVALAARPAPRVVLTLHSGLLPAFLAEAPRWLRMTARAALRGFSAIVAVSPEVASALTELGVPAERLTVRPAFLPPRMPEGDLSEDLRPWASTRYPLLSTALFYRHEYGLDVLLDALVALRRDYPRIGCVVLGSGDPDEARDMVVRRAVADAVRLVGDLDHERCLTVMRRSDVFVRPTRADGDSISVREARALGVRTVASRVGTRPEGVHLFAPGDPEDLARAVREALAAGAPTAAADGVDTVRTLLGLYGRPTNDGPAATEARPSVSGVRTDARALVRS